MDMQGDMMMLMLNIDDNNCDDDAHMAWIMQSSTDARTDSTIDGVEQVSCEMRA